MPILNKVRYNNIDYDLIGLGGDILPIGTEVDILSSSTIPAGWEEVVVNNEIYSNNGLKRMRKISQVTPPSQQEIYDDQERVIGTWFGKPLYRKTVYSTVAGKGTQYTVTTNITNLERCVNLYGNTYSNSGHIPINYPGDGNVSNINMCYLKKDGTEIIYRINYGDSFYVTIEYTKTTDIATL